MKNSENNISNFINSSLNNNNKNNNSNYVYESINNNSIKDNNISNRIKNEENIQIENIIFNSKCSSCRVYPIVCVINVICIFVKNVKIKWNIIILFLKLKTSINLTK